MALRGDDEIDSLLASWPASTSTTPASSAIPPARTIASSSRKKKKSNDGRHQRNKEKSNAKPKRGERSRINRGGESDGHREKKSKRNRDEKETLLKDTRLRQNCFEWPCSNSGHRWLILGSGLLHKCEGYVCHITDAEKPQTSYISNTCQSCGKSPASHELCLSSAWAEGLDDAVRDRYLPSIVSLVNIVVATRNARCVIGEYYPTSKTIPQEAEKEIGELPIQPPLTSAVCNEKYIMSNLDVFVGRALGSARRMQKDMTKKRKDHGRIQKVLKNQLPKVLIRANDIQLLQGKVSALVKTAQGYNEAMLAASSLEKAALIDLVEKRLMAMASCDIVYYRCYYAAIVAHGTCVDETGEGSDIAAMIPHPSTYFSCPGLAWDAHNAGVNCLNAFLGDGKASVASLFGHQAAQLDDKARNVLLESLGLNERLSPSPIPYAKLVGNTASAAAQSNPLLMLWQSRFLETIRHVWCTRYSAVKTSIRLREASKSKNTANRAQGVHGHIQDSQLKIHETDAISPALAQWRDSARDYPANFYAYAAPTKEALRIISNCMESSGVGQILEAGAGTGYWSALLSAHLKKNGMAPGPVPIVVPYDNLPPSSAINKEGNDRTDVSNEYHGNIPTFMDVHQAETYDQVLTSSTATNSTNPALLLCYPPPGSNMAQRALLAHVSNGGQMLIHIGEWRGLTGDAKFEALLKQKFYCQEKDLVWLPLWGTDTTYLSIWRKKCSEGEGNTQTSGITYSPALGFCSVKQCCNRARRRCLFARCLQYCSLDCFQKHYFDRRAVLALHMLHTTPKDEMRYEDDGHFRDLSQSQGSTILSTRRLKNKHKRKKR